MTDPDAEGGIMSEHLCEFRDRLCEALGRELVLKAKNELLQSALIEILRLHDVGTDNYETLALIAHEAQKALTTLNPPLAGMQRRYCERCGGRGYLVVEWKPYAVQCPDCKDQQPPPVAGVQREAWMDDLQLSFVCSKEHKYVLSMSAAFLSVDDALRFNALVVELCKQEMERSDPLHVAGMQREAS